VKVGEKHEKTHKRAVDRQIDVSDSIRVAPGILEKESQVILFTCTLRSLTEKFVLLE
jgi:hypothetical protein